MSTSWRMPVSPATGCSEQSSRATTLRGRFQLPAWYRKLAKTQVRLATHRMMETQIDSGLRHQGIERGIAGEAENVVRIVVFRPVHRLDPAIVAVAAPHDAGVRPMAAQMLGHMFDDGAHLAALRRARLAQDRRHRHAARYMIDVHRPKGDARSRTQAVGRHAPRRTCRR